MATISDGAIAKAANLAGFRGDKATIAVAVALAESGGNKDADNSGLNSDGSVDYGLWQINTVHRRRFPVLWSQRFNPYANAKMAFAISNGGSNWQPWVAYKNGSYAKFLPRARKATSNPDAMLGQDGSFGLGDIPGKILGIDGLVKALRNAGTRIAAVSGGLMLVAVGGVLVAKDATE